MIVLIAIIVLSFSLIGMGVILFRKVPVLTELSEVPGGFDFKIKFLQIKEKIKNSKYFKLLSFEVLLQKVLSKIRILSLKAENKISIWLQKLREKSQKKKENDKYWQELKKSINQDKLENNKNNLPS
ncbi:hypothetical protein KJA16_02275 [Patescibacteria group bacterium]|nr:hypothetical protein [Patescibacteria group bacterium]